MTIPAAAPRTPNLEERKALLWVRKHQPVDFARRDGPDAPKHSTVVKLLQAGWIRFDPKRLRFDPVRYVLTETGQKALEP